MRCNPVRVGGNSVFSFLEKRQGEHMGFNLEDAVFEVVSAIETAPPFSEGKVSEDIELYEHMPPVFIGQRDGVISIVIAPVCIPVGSNAEIKDEDGSVKPRFKVRIRRIIQELEKYREETLIQNSEVINEVLERCSNTGEPFFMYHTRGEQEQPVGIVMIRGMAGGPEGPVLQYQRLQGFLWLEQYLILNKFPASDGIRLVRMPEMVKDVH